MSGFFQDDPLPLATNADAAPNASGIVATLNELAEVRAAEAIARADYDAKRRAILESVRYDLDVLDAEYAPLFEAAVKRGEALEQLARAGVLAHGESVKADNLQAVYMRGRESWDGKALKGYAAAHPEVLQFQKVGEPSVSIRAVK